MQRQGLYRIIAKLRAEGVALALGAAMVGYLAALAAIFHQHAETISFAAHFVEQAKSWLHGRLDVPGWLGHDLVLINGKDYIVYPPAPALLIVPFVALLGDHFSDIWFGWLADGANIALLYHLLQAMARAGWTRRTWRENVIIAVTFGIGTIALWLAIGGAVWFTAQTLVITFTLLLLLGVVRRQWWLASLGLGALFLTRTPDALGAIVLVAAVLAPVSGTLALVGSRGKRGHASEQFQRHDRPLLTVLPLSAQWQGIGSATTATHQPEASVSGREHAAWRIIDMEAEEERQPTAMHAAINQAGNAVAEIGRATQAITASSTATPAEANIFTLLMDALAAARAWVQDGMARARRLGMRVYIALGVPFGLAVVIWLIHNQLYFGHPFSSGYDLQIQQDYPNIRYGLLSWHYIWPNFAVDFLNVPTFVFNTPYDLHPAIDWLRGGNGTSIFFTTPLFLLFFFPARSHLPEWARLALWVTVALLTIFTLFWNLTGYLQVGARYLFDAYPYLFVLLAARGGRINWRWLTLAALGSSINLVLAKTFWTRLAPLGDHHSLHWLAYAALLLALPLLYVAAWWWLRAEERAASLPAPSGESGSR